MNEPSEILKPDPRRVLVTYAWVRSSWAVMRNLARHGLEVHAGDHQTVFMSRYSRHVSGWFTYPHYAKDPEGFVEATAAYIRRHGIGTYIPSHEEGFIVAAHRDRFPEWLRLPISPRDTIDALDNKRRAQKLAAELGVPHPPTFTFDSPEEYVARREGLPERGIVKRLHSHGSHGVLPYDGREAMDVAWSEALTGLPPGAPLPIIQKRLEATIFAVSLLADRGEVLASFVRRNIRQKEPFGGTCVKCESVHFPEAVAHATRIAAHVGYTGVAMFEFLVDERTGEYWLMEINPRYWGTSSHDIDCGVEFPWMHYCMANGLPFERFPEYRDGLKSRWIAGDVISYLKSDRVAADRGANRRRYLDFDDDFHMDFKLDDPLPFFVQSWLYFKHRKAVLAAR